jgi:hypothetical protein
MISMLKCSVIVSQAQIKADHKKELSSSHKETISDLGNHKQRTPCRVKKTYKEAFVRFVRII